MADAEVRLRQPEPADVDIFFQQQKDPAAAARANVVALSRTRFTDHWRDKILGDDTVNARTVCVDGQVAGYVVAWWQDGRRSVGYWFGRAFWGRGAGTRALDQFLALEQTRPLFADTDVSNIASQRLLERCGFHLIETHRDPPARYVVLKLDRAS